MVAHAYNPSTWEVAVWGSRLPSAVSQREERCYNIDPLKTNRRLMAEFTHIFKHVQHQFLGKHTYS